MSELASELIRKAKETNAKELNLSSCFLTHLPKEILALTQLEVLNLGEYFYDFEKVIWIRSKNTGGRNYISDYRFLKELKNLTSLNLNSNYLTEVSVLKELKNLSKLHLNSNDLTDIIFLNELKKLIELDLGNNRLRDISVLKELKNLTGLCLSANYLSNVSILKELKNLRTLYLDGNNLTDVSFLKELKNLTILSLSNNNLTDVSSLKELKNLTILSLNNNHLTDVSFLKELKNLTILALKNNNLTDVGFLKELKNITSLDLSDNKLADVGLLKELRNLAALDLSDNKLTHVGFLKELRNLRALDLSDNKLTHLGFLNELPELVSVQFDKNPIKNPPEDVWKAGKDAILNYFKQLDKQGVDFLYEAKIIFVGEPGAGKTSLINKFIDINSPVPSQKVKETIGINIKEYSYPFTRYTKLNFKVNLWDFGGQDIQYTLHQYFLTSRALYVLVIDDRKENADLDYWFNIIKLLGEGSPVIVIANEIYKVGIINFDYPTYAARYKDLNMEMRQVDLSKVDNRLHDVLSKIKEMACEIEGIGDKLPKKWIPIRNDLLELEKQKHIDYTKYVEVCNKNKLKDTNDQKTLARVFHELGVFLHFVNDENLMDTIFLDPQWITDGLYTIIKDQELRANQGIFSKNKIYELWGTKYSVEEKSMLMRLMLKNNFEICYKLSDAKEEKYLFPLLLPFERPCEVEKWNHKENLRFRFQYQFMPKGLFTRLLVRISDYVYKENGKSIIWRTGAILSNGNSKALIYEDLAKDGRRVLDIFVQGDQYDKREFLSLIRQELEYIHQSAFRNLPVEKYIPCYCEKCANRTNEKPTHFEYNELLLYNKSNEQLINCSSLNSITKVSVEKLLEGIEDRRRHEIGFDRKEVFVNELESIARERRKIESQGVFNFTFNPQIELNQNNPQTVTNTPQINSPQIEPAKKKWYEKIQIWVAIIVGLVTITWFGINIIKSLVEDEKKETPPVKTEQTDSTTSSIKKDSLTNK